MNIARFHDLTLALQFAAHARSKFLLRIAQRFEPSVGKAFAQRRLLHQCRHFAVQACDDRLWRRHWHGQIIDATFVPVSIQRNGRESNALIKAGAVPLEWGQDTDQPDKLAHKDTDARWTTSRTPKDPESFSE